MHWRSLTVALLLAWSISGQTSSPTENAVDPSILFQKLGSLEGEWRGESTKGWEAVVRVDVIAGGSAVLFTSEFEAHPGETMVTAYHLDHGRLLLTHYCVAGNQPRLVATEWDESSGRARWSFLDGTNLGSRDDGHMDSVVLQFIDRDHFTSRWTWYQDGQERWLEEIVYERRKHEHR